MGGIKNSPAHLGWEGNAADAGGMSKKLEINQCREEDEGTRLGEEALCEKSQVRPNICSCNLTTLEVDNCQNSNFCSAVFSNESLVMSGSSGASASMEHWDAPCLCAPLNHLFSPSHQRGSSSVVSLQSMAWTVWIALLITL